VSDFAHAAYHTVPVRGIAEKSKTRARLVALLALIAAPTLAARPIATPSELYGPLYRAVEMGRLFPDSKTFADAVPRAAPTAIDEAFAAHPPKDEAALRRFVLDDFALPAAPQAARAAPSADLARHIQDLWPQLTRTTIDAPPGSSVLTLPEPYVVPGGRFRELYYWDSYFTMLGLARSDRGDLVDSMLDDFGSLIDRYGHIPNGTRTYYLTRSQPPVFALMIGLSADHSRAALARRNAWLIAEHRFWMAGEETVKPGQASRRVVRLADGSLLNRYWDDSATPRDESYREDLLLAKAHPERDPADLFRNIRAAAESGWDFSSRWLADGRSLGTIRTTHLAPVDLNSLMYLMERTIAANCQTLADAACARAYARRAELRRRAIRRHMWNGRFFADYDLDRRAPSPQLTAAAAFPLFARLASRAQAASDADALESLIGPGGLATTSVRSGQQWDAPNGWAPLQWIAVEGLRAYGHARQAGRISDGWLASVECEYRASGRMLEKYDVLEQRPGGGGEYPTQDGFGWTNGVTLALMQAKPPPSDRPSAP